MTHISAPTHWLIRRTPPIILIVRAQPESDQVWATSTTFQRPLSSCKQATFYQPHSHHDASSLSNHDSRRPS
jgi:hypothetical protein